MQTFQNLALRKLFNAPPNVSDHTLHTDFKSKSIEDEATSF